MIKKKTIVEIPVTQKTNLKELRRFIEDTIALSGTALVDVKGITYRSAGDYHGSHAEAGYIRFTEEL